MIEAGQRRVSQSTLALKRPVVPWPPISRDPLKANNAALISDVSSL